MSYNVDIKGTSNLGTISNDVRTFADAVKQASTTVSGAVGSFKAIGPAFQSIGTYAKPATTASQQMNSAMTQLSGAMRNVQTALNGGANAFRGIQGSLGATNTLLGQVTNTASQTAITINRLVGSAGPLASTFQSTGAATQKFSGALGQMNTQTVASTGSLTRYLQPLNQGTGTTQKFGQATQQAGGFQAQFSKNIGGTIIPIVGLTSSVAEAIGMFQTYMDVQQNVARVQEEVNALEREGATNTEQYRRASQELQSSQRGLNFVMRSTIQSFVDIITFIALVSNSFIKMAKAAKEAQKANEALGTGAATTTGFLTKMTGVFQTLYLRLGPVGIALLAIGGVLLALKTNIGGITDGFRALGKALGDAVPESQGFLKSMEAGAEQLGIIDAATTKTADLTREFGEVMDETAKEAEKLSTSYETYTEIFAEGTTRIDEHSKTLAKLTKEMDAAIAAADKSADARDRLAKMDEELVKGEKNVFQIIYENRDVILQSAGAFGEAEDARKKIAAVNDEVAASEAELADQAAQLVGYMQENAESAKNTGVELQGLNGMVLALNEAYKDKSSTVYAAGIEEIWRQSREYEAILNPLKEMLDNFNGSMEQSNQIMQYMADNLKDTSLEFDKMPASIQETVRQIGDLADKELTAADKLAIMNAALQGHDDVIRSINPTIADYIAEMREWIKTHIEAPAQAQVMTEVLYNLAEAMNINVDTIPDLAEGMTQIGEAMIDSTNATKQGSAELEASFAAQQEFLRQAIVSWHDYLGAVVSGQSDITSFTNVLKAKVEAGKMDEQVMKFLIDIYKEFDKLVKEGKEPIVAWGEAVVKVTDDLNNAATTTEATGLTMEEFGNMVTEALTDVEKAAAASIPIWGKLSDAIEAGFITQENYKDVVDELNRKIKDNTTATADQKAGYENATKAIEIYFKLTDAGLGSQIALNEAIKIANGQYSEYSGLIEKSSNTMSDFDKELAKVVESYNQLLRVLQETPEAQDAVTLAFERGKEAAAKFMAEIKTGQAEYTAHIEKLKELAREAGVTVPDAIGLNISAMEQYIGTATGAIDISTALAESFADLGKGAKDMADDFDADDWADDFGDGLHKIKHDFEDVADELKLDENNEGIIALRFQAEMEQFSESLKEIGPLIVQAVKGSDLDFKMAVRDNVIMPMIEEIDKYGTPEMKAAGEKFMEAFDTAIKFGGDTTSQEFRTAIGTMVTAMLNMKVPAETVNAILAGFDLTLEEVQGSASDAAGGIEAAGSAASGAIGPTNSLAESLGSVAEKYGAVIEKINSLKGGQGLKELAADEANWLAMPGTLTSAAEMQKKKEEDQTGTTTTPTTAPQITLDTQPAITAIEALKNKVTEVMTYISLAPQVVASAWPQIFTTAVTNSGTSLDALKTKTDEVILYVSTAPSIISQGWVPLFNLAVAGVVAGPYANLQNSTLTALQAVVNQATMVIGTGLVEPFTTAITAINSGPFATLQNNALTAFQAVVNQAAALIPSGLSDQFYAAVDQVNSGAFAKLQTNSLIAFNAVVSQAATVIPQGFNDEFYRAVDQVIAGAYAKLTVESENTFKAVVNLAAIIIPEGLEGEFYSAVDQVISGPYAKLQTESQHAFDAVVNLAKEIIPGVVDVFESAVSDIVTELGKIETAASDAVKEVEAIGDAIDAIPTEKTITFKIEQKGEIPKFQHGGSFIANKPSLFVAGEAGRKERILVKPGTMPFPNELESQRRKKHMELRDLLSSFGRRGRYSKGSTAAGTGAGGTAPGGTVHEQPIEVVLTLPDKEITRVVKKVVWQETSGGYSSY